MKLKKIILSTLTILAFIPLFSYWDYWDETFTEVWFTNTSSDHLEKTFYNNWYGSLTASSWIDLPRMDMNWFQWDEPIVLVKSLINKVIEILPIVIFVMLLLWCFKMIVSIKDGEWAQWKKIIKQVILWTILFIISLYVVNLIAIFLNWAPIINVSNIFSSQTWPYML